MPRRVSRFRPTTASSKIIDPGSQPRRRTTRIRWRQSLRRNGVFAFSFFFSLFFLLLQHQRIQGTAFWLGASQDTENGKNPTRHSGWHFRLVPTTAVRPCALQPC
ncbi:hypothetical protein PgNI_06484 [Pyricularia grisea]|uniref:Uncharacterized protein n=1 Tax=Pyricularia grisea TaxID=148305 RepID=A0A6P8B7J9_PYRGI|nr:hypothetical protein PgNI_06484 [Pyricularia grisea]TLD11301.1 hypothetical protein PgNI_06484 [Pyricularia grisea]